MHIARPHPLSRRRSAARQARFTAQARERNRRANLSQDAAMYTCSCGYVFKAPVTTSVGCPHCCSPQAW